MSSNKINTPRPTLLIPQYPYENMCKNDKKQEEKCVEGEKQKNGKHDVKTKSYISFSNSHLHLDNSSQLIDNRDSYGTNNQYYVLHGQDPPDIYSINFIRVKNIVKYGIFFDMVAAFLFFVFNPYFLFFSFFNLLFAYLGWYGIKSYDTSYLGSYTIYMFMKIVAMIAFFVYVCANQHSYFDTNNSDTADTTFIWFCSTYSFFLCLYVYFYVNIMKYIRLLLK